MSKQERTEAAEWLEADAAYLKIQAAKYAATWQAWLADLVSENAEHSTNLASEYRKEP